MSTSYESSGRIAQKSRTRAALVAAARQLLAAGGTPRVEDAAGAAGISRTTAYRYFANQQALLLAAQPGIQPDSLLDDDAPTDPHERLDAFMAAFTRYNLEWQPQLRAALRISLDPASGQQRPALRTGRAVGWVAHALAPLRASHPKLDVEGLAVAIRAATGIESLIWLLDIAGLTPDQAAERQRCTARALLDAALAEHR